MPEALDRLFSWQNEVTERCNADGSDTLTSIASKLEIYAVRFCLLLALADWACSGKKKKAVDVATVERAIRLTEYFRVTAAGVQGIVSEDSLTEIQTAVLSDLPDTFTTAEGVAIAAKNGPRLSADDIMTRDNLTSFQDTYAKAMERFGLERGVRG